MPSVLITDFMGDDTALEERHAPLRAPVIDRLASCRVIARYGSGHDNIDVARATARGITVTNVPDYSTDEVADHAVALLLAAARHLPTYTSSVRQGRWTPRPLPPVKRMRGRRLALLGFGRIGRAVAQRMLPFGLRIVVHDPLATDLPGGVLHASDIDELVQGAHFLSLHAPLTPRTAGCIDAGSSRAWRSTSPTRSRWAPDIRCARSTGRSSRPTSPTSPRPASRKPSGAASKRSWPSSKGAGRGTP